METKEKPQQLDDEKAMQRFLENFSGGEVKIPQVPKETLKAFYANGYALYQNGQYENAMHHFRFLTFFDNKKRKYWMGLGAAYQMLKEYERALQCYGYAALLDETDPTAHFYAAECFFATKQTKPGKHALRSAKTVASRDPKKHKTLLAQIALISEANKKPKK